MKNKIKILIASCIMLLCAGNVSAQWRFGVEWNHFMYTQYNYDNNGIFQNKSLNASDGKAGFFTAEYILPRNWTPNWLVLSVQGKLGGGPIGNNNNMEGDFWIGSQRVSEYSAGGLMVPIDIELKYLLSNTCRFFINGGVPNIINLTSDKAIYKTGFEFGLGFEFAFFRIVYKNVNFNNTLIPENIGNKYNNMHTITAGFIFNGNRFLKKKSSMKAY